MKNKTLYQIFKEKHLMAQVLPEYLSEWTTKKVKDEKVHCIPNTEVKDVYMKSGQLSLILTNGQVVSIYIARKLKQFVKSLFVIHLCIFFILGRS